jgi:PBP1b-binding outer membrane lipoprotein LpoB
MNWLADMKKLSLTLTVIFFALALNGCLASTTSPDGVNCNYSQEKPLWEMPIACQGR